MSLTESVTAIPEDKAHNMILGVIAIGVNSTGISPEEVAKIVPHLYLGVTELLKAQRELDAQRLHLTRDQARIEGWNERGSDLKMAYWYGYINALEEAYNHITGETMPEDSWRIKK